MQPDPVRMEDTRGWLVNAQKDLRSAEHGLSAAPPLLEDVVFHCQQAIEKALKGFLPGMIFRFAKKWGQTSLFLYFAFAALGLILFQPIM
jgi:hypothetical protein